MGIIRRTFSFWLIIGIIAALAISLFMPGLKRKAIEQIPGRDQALNLIKQAKKIINKQAVNLPETLEKKAVVQHTTKLEPVKLETEQVSTAGRDGKLFKRQCSILDDLLQEE